MDVSDFEIITNPSERSHILTNLLPWTTYNISVQVSDELYFELKLWVKLLVLITSYNTYFRFLIKLRHQASVIEIDFSWSRTKHLISVYIQWNKALYFSHIQAQRKNVYAKLAYA